MTNVKRTPRVELVFAAERDLRQAACDHSTERNAASAERLRQRALDYAAAANEAERAIGLYREQKVKNGK